MIRRRALVSSNSSRSLRLWIPVMAWLVLQHVSIPSWAHGVAWTVIAVFQVLFVIDFFTAEDVELK